MDCPVCGDRMEFSHISEDGEMCVYQCKDCGTEQETSLTPDEEEQRALSEFFQNEGKPEPTADEVEDWV